MDLQGTQNGDTLTGGADSDTIYGFGGNDTLKGLAGDDVLAGHDGNDTLLGGAGDDYLLGGAGNDTLDGGDGNDWAAYEDATAGVKVDLNLTGAQNTGGGGTDKLISIENVYGSAFNDTLTGDAGNNMLVGDAGNDIITGGKGDDTLWGDAGNDTLDGGDGDDWMVGGAGDDIIKGGAGVDWASYENATAGVTVDLTKTTAQDTIGAGKDTITGVENLWGSDFADTLTGDAKDNYLWGGDGDDKLYGGAGDDHLSGGKGYNVISGGDGFDTVDYSFSDKGVEINLNQGPPPMGGSPWNYDIITGVEAAMGSAYDDTITGNASENYLFGDAGDDVLTAVGGNDTLDGGDGDDYLFGGTLGGDLLIGGAGDDTVVISASATVDGGEGVDTLHVLSQADLKIDLRIVGEQQVATGLRLTVSGIENLTGGSGNDTLIGDAKDNMFMGGRGNDTLDGGAGSDTVTYLDDGMLGSVVIDLGKAAQVLTDGRGTDTLISIENVIGTSGDDKITGNADANHLQGGDGDDQLFGMGGADVLEGGYGNDVLDGGDGFDIASYEHVLTGVRVDLSKTGPQDTHGAGMDTLKNFEGLKGTAQADILIGDANANTFEGGKGDDIIDGGAGVDTAIYAGASKDYSWTRNTNGSWTVKGAEGSDTLLNIETLKFSDKSVTLSSSTTTTTVDDLVKPKVIATSEKGELNDAVLSADGHTVYVSDKTGYVSAINTTTGETTGRWKVGVQPAGMDLSVDGRFLAITEAVVEATKDKDGNAVNLAKVYILDLTTGQTRQFSEKVYGAGNAFGDVAFLSDGTLFLTQGGGGGSYTIAPTLDPATGVFKGLYANGGVLSVSDDHTKIFTSSPDMSNAPVALLTVGQTGVYNNYGGGTNVGIQAIAGDGSLVARGYYGGSLEVLDSQLKHVADVLTPHHETNSLYGMDFNADGSRLYVVEKNSDKIYEYSTHTWTIERVISLGVDVTTGLYWYEGAGFGDRVRVSDDGARLIVFGISQVISVNLTGATADGGTDHDDVLVGTAGADVLEGYAGHDTLIGGAGTDMLTGGDGVDTFAFANGDSSWAMFKTGGADVITDWEYTDRLSFGPHTEYVHYEEQTVGSVLQAITVAPQIMATKHLSYLALQVEKDVYVFAAPSGVSDGSVETVVKLANTTLDKISLDNFQPVGDDGANLLIGGALDDRINGLGGADIINGGKGNDVLTGGAGADVFQFNAGDGAYNRQLLNFDTITDFGAGDKLAFEGAPSQFTAATFTNIGHYDRLDAATLLTLEAHAKQYEIGAIGQKYMVFGVGADTYVLADTDPANIGYDQVVLLKNVASSVVTADMFMAA